MKILKLTLICLTMAMGMVLCLWAADMIAQDMALETLKRMGMIIGILGMVSGVVLLLSGGRGQSPVDSSSKNSGPKF